MLGIAIFIAFSLALSIYMRLDPARMPSHRLPAGLGQWHGRAEHGGEEVICETRQLLQPGSLFTRHRLIEQVRYRDQDGRIVRVDPEKVVDSWFL